MSKLDRLIKEKIEYLSQIEIDTTSLDFLQTINTNAATICKTSNIDILTAFYLVMYDCSLKEAQDKSKKMITLLDILMLATYKLDEFLNVLKAFDEASNEAINGYISLSDILVQNLNDYDIDKEEAEDFQFLQSSLKKLIKKTNKEDTEQFLNFLRHPKGKEIIFYISNKNFFEELQKETKKVGVISLNKTVCTSKRQLKRQLNRNKDNMKNYLANKLYDNQINVNVANWFNSEKSKRQNEITSQKRQINQSIKNLQDLKQQLDNNSLTLKKLKSYNLDEEIYYLSLIELIKKENKHFQQHYFELKELEENPISKLETLFDSYGYNFLSLPENIQTNIKNIKLETLEEKLKIISSTCLNFLESNDEAFLKIIFLESNDIHLLQTLLEFEVINQNIILSKSEIINKRTIEHLYNLFNNFRTLNFANINAYNDSLLPTLNINLLNTIMSYGIDLNNPFLKKYDFLENPKLLDMIDRFIEVGALKQIQENPNLIDEQSNIIIKRIILLQMLKENYLTRESTLNSKVRKGTEFYIGDNEIDEYVYENYLNYINPDIYFTLTSEENILMLEKLPTSLEFIEEYKTSDYTYQIDEKIFSRLKILRCLNTLIDKGYTNYNDLLFNCLIYNHPNYLSPEDLEKLKDLTSKNMKKQLN